MNLGGVFLRLGNRVRVTHLSERVREEGGRSSFGWVGLVFSEDAEAKVPGGCSRRTGLPFLPGSELCFNAYIST